MSIKAVKYVGPLVAYGTYILVMGSVRDGGPPSGMTDKAAHFIAFGLMVPVALLAVTYLSPRRAFAAQVVAAVAVASGLGALLEVWQYLLPWRSAEFLDWVADTFGALGVGGVTLAWRAVTGTRQG
jgi:VanZ family protein